MASYLLLAFVVVAGLFGLLRLYLHLISKYCKSKVILRGKTALVTGASAGIGYITALDLASRGARVILAVRDPIRGEDARRKIVRETNNPNVVVRLVDFASLDSVRAFAKDINNTEERLDILVNNAGSSALGDYRTGDGLSALMHVNHFGPFLLTNLLIPLLKASAPSRIVTVSSLAASHSEMTLDELNTHGKYTKAIHKIVLPEYCNSKLCNILMSNELARRLENTGVTSNSLHPGTIKTEIERNRSVFRTILMRPFRRSAEWGAQTQIYCAVAKELENVSGKFFENCEERPMYSSVDEDFARKVWEKSELLVKLRPGERHL